MLLLIHFFGCFSIPKLDAPKFAADVVESLIGAVYMDSSSLEAGINAVKHVLAQLMPLLKRLHAKDNKLNLVHPRKELQELGGSLLTMKVTREEDFAAKYPKGLVWLGRQQRWRTASVDGAKFVGSVACMGLPVVSVLESSVDVAGNRACALVAGMLKKYPNLLSRVRICCALVQSSLAREEKERAAKKTLCGIGPVSRETATEIVAETSVTEKDKSSYPDNDKDKEDILIIESMAPEGREALLRSMITSVLDWL